MEISAIYYSLKQLFQVCFSIQDEDLNEGSVPMGFLLQSLWTEFQQHGIQGWINIEVLWECGGSLYYIMGVRWLNVLHYWSAVPHCTTLW